MGIVFSVMKTNVGRIVPVRSYVAMSRMGIVSETRPLQTTSRGCIVTIRRQKQNLMCGGQEGESAEELWEGDGHSQACYFFQ